MQASDLEYEESLIAELEIDESSNYDSGRSVPSLSEICSRAFIPIATVEVVKTFPYELVECIQHYIDDYQLQKTLCGSIKAWHPNGNLKVRRSLHFIFPLYPPPPYLPFLIKDVRNV